MDKRFYISTAIAYASAKPHIGNTYEIVLADAIARYKRLEGFDVYFQTGTDEHGEKIENKAKEANMEPQQYVDEIALEVRKIWDVMNTSYDKFIRTTNKAHEEQVAKIFKQLNTENRYFDSINFNGTEAGTILNKPEPLFVRIEKDKKIEELKNVKCRKLSKFID